ncbi:MAG: ABC transporter permease [Armatimonadetes bacterium]|nr:ABC transporter permease [Armatimonadota bacterium]
MREFLSKLGAFMQRYGVVVAFGLLFAYNGFTQPEFFLQPENLKNLVNQSVGVGIIAIGMTLVIVTGGIDLSVGSMLALSGALGVLAMNKVISGVPVDSAPAILAATESRGVVVGIAVCLLAGLVLGMVNGVTIVVGRVAPFIATLVGLVAYRSICVSIAEGGEIRSLSAKVFPALGSEGVPVPGLMASGGRPLIITWGMILFVLVALFAGFLLNWTRFGRHALAVGANERAAKYSAVNTGWTKFVAYSLLGLFSGLAAFTYAARLNSVASSTAGNYYELDAIAAVVIGGTSLRGGSGRIWATVVGVLLLSMIGNMLVMKGVSVYWQGTVKGAIILVAVLLQRGREG